MNIFVSAFQDFGSAFSLIWRTIALVWFVVLPPVFYYLFKVLWLDHVRLKFKKATQWVILELIPPRDIEKSPRPMESIFAGLAGVLKTLTTQEEYLKGELIPYFCFEIVSIEGNIHFYVRVKKALRNLIEANFYAQYPNIEILEVPDYTDAAPKIIPNKDWTLWGTDYQLTKDDAYPIKTYKFFEETITGEQLDPLLGVLEVMAKMGPGEQLWFQILVLPEKETWMESGGLEIVQKLAGRSKEREKLGKKVKGDFMDVLSNIPRAMLAQEMVMSKKEETKEQSPLEFRLTPGEKDVLKAVESNIGKYVFSTKMRQVYIAKREVFSKATGVSAFIGGIKQFADFNLNSFKPNDKTKTYANYLWRDTRLRYRQRKIYRRYKDRDLDGPSFILSTEELATIFHIPDKSVLTPTVARVMAKRGSAPSNLPI